MVMLLTQGAQAQGTYCYLSRIDLSLEGTISVEEPRLLFFLEFFWPVVSSNFPPDRNFEASASTATIRDMGTARGTRTVADAIGALEVEKVLGATGDLNRVPLSSFWTDQAVLIHVLRRFGCQLCRGGAVEMGKIFPELEAHGVRIVGIGIEKVGLEDFQKGKFWKGELYIDNGKNIHKALDIQKVGLLGSVKMMLSNKGVKEAIKKTKDTPGDFKGDGRQLGGTFILAKGGETLLDFRQVHFGDHPSNADILEAFGLDSTAAKEASPAESSVCIDFIAA